MDIADRSPGLKLALTVSPRMVSAVRRLVDTFAEGLGADTDLSARVALTAHELFENVAKYGVDRSGVLRLALVGDGERGRRLVIAVSNRARPAHVERLKVAFDEMNGGPDPTTFYFNLMMRDTKEGESGLGLARIRAEAEMALGLEVVGEEVSIIATSPPFTPIGDVT